jgi:hypothetical protein
MSTYPEVLDRMLAIWNERDPNRIRGRIDSALSGGVIFVDPANSIEGRDAFEAMVKAFRAQNPDAVCSRSSGVDSHHGLHRYHWQIHRRGELFIEGFDVAEVDGEGRVSRVLGFFGPIPVD